MGGGEKAGQQNFQPEHGGVIQRAAFKTRKLQIQKRDIKVVFAVTKHQFDQIFILFFDVDATKTTN